MYGPLLFYLLILIRYNNITNTHGSPPNPEIRPIPLTYDKVSTLPSAPLLPSSLPQHYVSKSQPCWAVDGYAWRCDSFIFMMKAFHDVNIFIFSWMSIWIGCFSFSVSIEIYWDDQMLFLFLSLSTVNHISINVCIYWNILATQG